MLRKKYPDSNDIDQIRALFGACVAPNGVQRRVFAPKGVRNLSFYSKISSSTRPQLWPVLRDMRPELKTPAAIRLWVQLLVDAHLQQMEFEDTETMSIEEACEMTLAAVREEYARS